MSRAEIEKLVKKRCSKQCNGQKTDEIGERQQKKLTGDAKKMKKSIRKIERRTRGRDTGADNDVLSGGGNVIFGGSGNSLINAQGGNDTLIGKERLKNWSGSTCAVLFGRGKGGTANDVCYAVERKVA